MHQSSYAKLTGSIFFYYPYEVLNCMSSKNVIGNVLVREEKIYPLMIVT